jgi:hypothetical protein
MALETIDIVNGILATIFVIFSVIVGLKIALKYLKYKNRVFLFFGITWILIVEPWYPFMISFFVALSTGGTGLPLQTNLLIGHALIPFGVFCGIFSFTELKYNKYQKKILIIFGILLTIFEVVFLFCLITQPTIIAKPVGTIYIEYTPLFKVLMIAILVVILTVGILFAHEPLKAGGKEVRLKGKMLLFAFIMFSIGTFMEAMIPKDFLILIITRAILIFSSFSFYCGFYLPKFIKKMFNLFDNNY